MSTHYAPNPTSKKLTGHIGFVLCLSSSRTMHARVLKFHLWIPHGKIADTRFVFLSELSPPFLKFCPFEKNQNEIWCLPYLKNHAPCMLGFWNFIYGFLVEKKLTRIFFLVRVISRSYGPLKIWHFKLICKISRNVFELRAWNLVSW